MTRRPRAHAPGAPCPECGAPLLPGKRGPMPRRCPDCQRGRLLDYWRARYWRDVGAPEAATMPRYRPRARVHLATTRMRVPIRRAIEAAVTPLRRRRVAWFSAVNDGIMRWALVVRDIPDPDGPPRFRVLEVEGQRRKSEGDYPTWTTWTGPDGPASTWPNLAAARRWVYTHWRAGGQPITMENTA